MTADSGLHSRLRSYAAALALVALTEALRVWLAKSPAGLAAPFVFFYPAIALGAYVGGIGPGLAASAFAAVVGLIPLSVVPAPVNWLFLGVLGPLIVLIFARLQRLREKNTLLAKEAHRLRFVVDRASDWIFLVDENGVIQYVNQTASNQLGIPAAQLVGRRLLDLVAEPHRNAVRDVLERCRREPVLPIEAVFTRSNGSPAVVEIGCTAVAVSSEDFRVVHIAGRDVTERKAVDRRLAEARQWEGLRVLARGVAHDFNNLLTSMMGNASLARVGLPAEHPVANLLLAIEGAGERSADLVHMMLASSGYCPRTRGRVRVNRILRRLLEERPVGAHVVVNADDDAEIDSDERTVETLLWSLISNAAEAYGKTGGEVLVSVRNLDKFRAEEIKADFEAGEIPAGPCVEIRVEDSGCGMTHEVLERAFEPFFTTKFAGRGLGLPAVRGIVRAQSGKLRLSTRLAVGTAVEVWLPRSGYARSGYDRIAAL